MLYPVAPTPPTPESMSYHRNANSETHPGSPERCALCLRRRRRARFARRLRALWRAFDAMLDTESGRGFQRALRVNLDALSTIAWWSLIIFGIAYFLGRGFVSLRWGV